MRALLIILLFIHMQLGAEVIDFSWDPIEKTLSYRVIVCSDEECRDILYSKITKVTSFKDEFDPGIYYISIAPISKSGQEGYYSKPIEFVILPKSPELISPENREKIIQDEIKPVEFSWETVKSAKYYTVELVDSEGRIKLINSETNNLTITDPLLGEFSWRVKANIGKLKSGNFSERRTFSIHKKLIEVTSFAHNSKIPLLAETIPIKWSGEDFEIYKFQLEYKANIFGEFKVETFIETEKNEYILVDPKLGHYRINIQGRVRGKFIPAKTHEFQLVKREHVKNTVKVYLVIGAPKSSITINDDPDYTSASKTNPETLLMFSVNYERKINTYCAGVNLSHSLFSKHVGLRVANIYGSTNYETPYLTLVPSVGLYNFNFSHKSEEGNNFLVKSYTQIFAGGSIRYIPEVSRQSLVEFKFNLIGPHDRTNGFDTEINYEYITTQGQTFIIGLNYFKLSSKYYREDDTLQGISQSFLGLKFGYKKGFSFNDLF